MITFQTYNEICLLRNQKCLSYDEIALRLHLDIRTITKWAGMDRYQPRKATKPSSILGPYKLAIRRDMELGEHTSTEIFNRLKQMGYTGGYTVIKKYIRSLRTNLPDQDKQLMLPFEWMLRLIQGKITADMITTDIGTLVSSGDISVLVQRIHDGDLKIRNKAVSVLAYMKNIPKQAIARFLSLIHISEPTRPY